MRPLLLAALVALALAGGASARPATHRGVCPDVHAHGIKCPFAVKHPRVTATATHKPCIPRRGSHCPRAK